MTQYNAALDGIIRTLFWKAYDLGIFSVIIAAIAIYIFWLALEQQNFSPHYRLWAYIVGVTFMADTVAIIWTWGWGWQYPVMAALLPALGVLIYFAPTAAAISWQHPAFDSIFIVNLFTGWTIIGWGAAFVWAWRSPWRTTHINIADRLTPSAEIAASLQAPIETSRNRIENVRQLLRHRG
ncbi:MAG TPA: superinfection immunity protein [Candidatus Binataceae bacterium]|nr:superinfection immunity protein [Candidatus Binataceae bacterium]